MRKARAKPAPKAPIGLVAILGIIFLECVALANGINGVALTSSIAAIAAIGGYSAKPDGLLRTMIKRLLKIN